MFWDWLIMVSCGALAALIFYTVIRDGGKDGKK